MESMPDSLPSKTDYPQPTVYLDLPSRPPAYVNYPTSIKTIVATRNEFLEVGMENNHDNQIERYNSPPADILSMDESIAHQREALRQAIKNNQRELQDLQSTRGNPGMSGRQ